jgi:hypothetical protein
MSYSERFNLLEKNYGMDLPGVNFSFSAGFSNGSKQAYKRYNSA